MKIKTRYFIVYFLAVTKDMNRPYHASISVTNENGFFSFSEFKKELIEENPLIDEIVLTGYNELTKGEFETFES